MEIDTAWGRGLNYVRDHPQAIVATFGLISLDDLYQSEDT